MIKFLLFFYRSAKDVSKSKKRTVGVVEPRVVVKIPWAKVKGLKDDLKKGGAEDDARTEAVQESDFDLPGLPDGKRRKKQKHPRTESDSSEVGLVRDCVVRVPKLNINEDEKQFQPNSRQTFQSELSRSESFGSIDSYSSSKDGERAQPNLSPYRETNKKLSPAHREGEDNISALAPVSEELLNGQGCKSSAPKARISAVDATSKRQVVPILPVEPPQKRKRGRPTFFAKQQEKLWLEMHKNGGSLAGEKGPLDVAKTGKNNECSRRLIHGNLLSKGKSAEVDHACQEAVNTKVTREDKVRENERVNEEEESSKVIKIPPTFCQLSLDNVIFTKRCSSRENSETRDRSNKKLKRSPSPEKLPTDTTPPTPPPSAPLDMPTIDDDDNTLDDLLTPIEGLNDNCFDDAVPSTPIMPTPVTQQPSYLDLLDNMDDTDMPDFESLISSGPSPTQNADAEEATISKAESSSAIPQSNSGEQQKQEESPEISPSPLADPGACGNTQSTMCSVGSQVAHTEEENKEVTIPETIRVEKTMDKDTQISISSAEVLEQDLRSGRVMKITAKKRNRKLKISLDKVPDKWYVCDSTGCGYWTSKPERMERHLKFHVPYSKHLKCPDCAKTLYTLAKALRHDRIEHTGVKDYECKYCGAEVIDLAIHLRVSFNMRHRKRILLAFSSTFGVLFLALKLCTSKSVLKSDRLSFSFRFTRRRRITCATCATCCSATRAPSSVTCLPTAGKRSFAARTAASPSSPRTS